MKLSSHGLGNICYHQSLNLSLGSYEFEPEDFTGGVMLTTNEARIIFNLLTEGWRRGIDDFHTCQAEETIHRLCKRLERAEENDE